MKLSTIQQLQTLGTRARYGYLLAVLFLALGSAFAQTTTTFDISGNTGLFPTAINLQGTAAGYYFDGTGAHGFVRDAQGNLTTFSTPGFNAGSSGTQVWGINNSGVVIGDGYVVGLTSKGFVRDAQGNITVIDVPNSGVVTPAAINDNGQIAGHYGDASFRGHGF